MTRIDVSKIREVMEAECHSLHEPENCEFCQLAKDLGKEEWLIQAIGVDMTLGMLLGKKASDWLRETITSMISLGVKLERARALRELCEKETK